MIKSLMSMLLVALLFVSTLGYTAHQLQKPDFLSKQAREVNLYGRLTPHIGSIIPEEGNSMPITGEDLTSIVTNSVDAETFYNFTSEYTTAYLSWLKGDTDTLSFSYNMEPIKSQLVSQLSDKAISRYNNLPLCQTSQLRTWDASTSFPECRLSQGNVKANDVDRLLQQQSRDAVSFIPDTLAVSEPSQELLKARENTINVNRTIKFIWLATAALTLLYLAIFRRRALFSLALIFLVVGLLQVAFSLVAWDWIGKNVAEYVANNKFEAKEIGLLAVDMAEAILQVLKTIMGSISIIFLGLGGTFLVLSIISHFHRPRKDSSERRD